MTLEILFKISSFLTGLLVGSFLNVCIYRLPRGQSVVVPRSHCPQCGRFIGWYDNIPLISFVLLAGKCRRCRKKIPDTYPLVEFLSAVMALAIYQRFGLTWTSVFYFFFLSAPLIAITFIDLKHRLIPDRITLPGMALGLLFHLILNPFSWQKSLTHSLTGLAVGGGILLIISWLYEKLRHREGIGGGDIKLAAMLGAFFGWKEVILILFLSSLIGSIIGIFFILFSKKDTQAAIPFGPFLAIATWTTLFFGKDILHWYLHTALNLY